LTIIVLFYGLPSLMIPDEVIGDDWLLTMGADGAVELVKVFPEGDSQLQGIAEAGRGSVKLPCGRRI